MMEIYCLPFLKAPKFKIKVPAHLVLRESSLPGLQMVIFLVGPDMAEKEMALSSFLLRRPIALRPHS